MLLREGEALARRVLPPALRSETEPTVGEVEYWEDRIALRLGSPPHSLARFGQTFPLGFTGRASSTGKTSAVG